MSNSIKVVARFRPQNRTELAAGGLPIVTFEDEETCRLDVSIYIRFDGHATDDMNSRKKPQAPSPSTVSLT